jgi:hypothetical protein
VGKNFSKASVAQKNNDRVAVNPWHGLASFWIDVRGQEVKVATDVHGAESENFAVVSSMPTGVV